MIESKEYNKQINIKDDNIYTLIVTGDDLVDYNENPIKSFVGIFDLSNMLFHFDDGFVIGDYFEGDDKEFESKIKSLKIGELYDIDGDYSSFKIIRNS